MTPTHSLCYLQLNSKSDKNNPSSFQLSFIISGSNSESYTVPNTITYSLESKSSIQPTLQIVSTTINQLNITIQLKCSLKSTIYYYLVDPIYQPSINIQNTNDL